MCISFECSHCPAYGKAIMFVRLPRCHSVNNLGLNTNGLKLRSVAYTPRWTVENCAGLALGDSERAWEGGGGEGGVVSQLTHVYTAHITPSMASEQSSRKANC